MVKPKTDKQYQHFFKPSPPRQQGYLDHVKKMRIVSSYEELAEVLNAHKDDPWCAMDWETTGLNPEKLEAVGGSLAWPDGVSIYFPVNHGEYNLPLAPEIVYKFMTRKKSERVWMHNAKFDLAVWEITLGFEKEKIPHGDTQILSWLTDTNVKLPGLKSSVKHFLGWEMQTFEEVAGGSGDFSSTDPEESFEYACADAIGTLRLAEHLYPRIERECKMPFQLDNAMVNILLDIEKEPIAIDQPFLAEYEHDAVFQKEKLERSIIERIGRPINLNSTDQLAQALKEQGVPLMQKTATGKTAVGEGVLQKHQERFPIVSDILERRGLEKLKGTYLNHLTQDRPHRFAYLICNVPTGRLSSKKEKKNDFYTGVNIQAVTKPKQINWGAVPDDRFSEVVESGDVPEPDRSYSLLGYTFFMPDPGADLSQYGGGEVEGFEPPNLRQAFRGGPPDDDKWLWCGVDYSGQELRIAANLSGEPVWIDLFLNGGDLHKDTAIKIFGENGYNKNRRKQAKPVNFGILYGGTEYTLIQNSGFTEDEAVDAILKHKMGYPTLWKWIRSTHHSARRRGYVRNYFGRPRRLKFYYDNKSSSYADRSAINTPIQGMGCELLKISLIRLWERMSQQPSLRDIMKVKALIHDEIGFALHRDYLEESTKVIRDCMIFPVKGWQVPMEVEFEIGPSWGMTFPFEADLTPSFE